jgi:hypothetical protein
MMPSWPLKPLGLEEESSCIVKEGMRTGKGVLMLAPEPWVMRQPLAGRRTPVSCCRLPAMTIILLESFQARFDVRMRLMIAYAVVVATLDQGGVLAPDSTDGESAANDEPRFS